jgi:hypothetical protein
MELDRIFFVCLVSLVQHYIWTPSLLYVTVRVHLPGCIIFLYTHVHPFCTAGQCCLWFRTMKTSASMTFCLLEYGTHRFSHVSLYLGPESLDHEMCIL